jgi:uncharacterized protein (TIGR02466 family)
MIQYLFQVPVLSVQLDLDVKSIEHFCMDYQKKNKSIVKSNMGGYQSDYLDIEDKYLKPLVDEIKKYCGVMATEQTFEQEFRSMEMWLNINDYKDYNISHNHPGSVFSGVYYVKTLPDCGSIIFEHPGLNVLQYATCSLTYKEWKPNNSLTWWQPPKENMLYVFPSWLNHNVEPNLSEEQRISLSFNTTV